MLNQKLKTRPLRWFSRSLLQSVTVCIVAHEHVGHTSVNPISSDLNCKFAQSILRKIAKVHHRQETGSSSKSHSLECEI